MRKHSTLTLTGVGTTDKLERGKLELEKGKKAMGVRFKATIPIKNLSGGALAMTASQRKLMLANLMLNYFNCGKDGRFQQPYQNVDFARLRKEAKRAYGTELEGWDDSSTGLAKSLAAGATGLLVFYPIIPTGKLWWLQGREKNLFGMGRSQCRSVEFELKRAAKAIDANFEIPDGSNATFEVIPDDVSCKGDPWSVIPEYLELDEVDKFAKLPDGLHLAIIERNAVHASSVLTNIDLDMDEEKIHQGVSAAEIIIPTLDASAMPAAALLTDEETLLYTPGDGEKRLKDLPTGVPKVTQNVKDLPTIKLGTVFFPVLDDSKWVAAVDHVARLRKKDIRAISLVDREGLDIPHRMRFAMPVVMVDRDDREFEECPGYVGGPDLAKAQLTVPEGVLERAKGLYALHKAKGEDKAASHVVKTLAAAASPSAVQSGRGFRNGFSGVLDKITGFFK